MPSKNHLLLSFLFCPLSHPLFLFDLHDFDLGHELERQLEPVACDEGACHQQRVDIMTEMNIPRLSKYWWRVKATWFSAR